MKLFRWPLLGLLLFACGTITSTEAAELKANDIAPDFQLPGSDGAMHRLSDLTQEQVVVIAWFPKAFTGG